MLSTKSFYIKLIAVLLTCSSVVVLGQSVSEMKRAQMSKQKNKEVSRPEMEMQAEYPDDAVTEDSPEFIACKQITPKGDLQLRKEKKNCFKGVAEEIMSRQEECAGTLSNVVELLDKKIETLENSVNTNIAQVNLIKQARAGFSFDITLLDNQESFSKCKKKSGQKRKIKCFKKAVKDFESRGLMVRNAIDEQLDTMHEGGASAYVMGYGDNPTRDEEQEARTDLRFMFSPGGHFCAGL